MEPITIYRRHEQSPPAPPKPDAIWAEFSKDGVSWHKGRDNGTWWRRWLYRVFPFWVTPDWDRYMRFKTAPDCPWSLTIPLGEEETDG